MINRTSEAATKRALLANIPEGLIQVREIQAHIQERVTGGKKLKNGLPAWVEIIPGGARVRVTRWIE